MSVTPFPEIVREIQRAAELFLDGAHPVEVRAPKTKRAGTISGYFDDALTLAKAVRSYDGKVPSLYVTLNPCSRDALARAANRLVERADVTTKDPEIVRRRWLLVDLDPVRLTGTSATNEEHAATRERALLVAAFLTDTHEWPEPVVADSGNGTHLLYRIDLPNDAEASALVQRVLHELAARFDDEAVKVDKSVHNAARITKLYGTKTCKGDDTADRPHRRSHLIEVPPTLTVVTAEQLATVAPPATPTAKAAQAPATAPAAPVGKSYDVEGFIARHGLEVAKEGAWQGGYRWELAVCPWDDTHLDNSAWIARYPSGAIGAGCHHNSCNGRKWQDLRLKFEPKRERPAPAPQPEPEPEVEDHDDEGDPDLMTIAERPAHPAKAAPGLAVGLFEMRRNYVVIAGTESIFCKRTGKLMKASAVRLLHPKKFKEWSENPTREACDIERLVFKPGGCGPDELNLFVGLPKLEVRVRNADTWVNHVSRACEYQDEAFDWVIKRLAFKVQNPGRKIGTSIVLHGLPGSGKNLMFAPLLAIFGQYGREVGQIQVDSQYTGWLSGALFLLCDEVEITATRTQNKLKALITSPRVAIEEKYQPVRFEDNFADLHFLSNGVAPIVLEAGDRRYMVLRMDEVGAPDYYRELAAVDPGAVREFLLGVDVGGWNPNEPPPMTARKEELFRLTKSSAERFLDEWRAGELPVPAGAALAADLYTAYATWAKTRGEAKDLVSIRKFGCVATGMLERTVVRIGERTAKAYVEPDTHQAGDLVAGFVRALEGWIKSEQARKL